MPRWKNKPKSNILCSRCNSKTDHYEFNPLYGLQKYCCRSCKHQFTPRTPKKIHKAPKFSCSKCSAKMSAQAYNKILKVSRTIADLAESKSILVEHISETIQYRNSDRQWW